MTKNTRSISVHQTIKATAETIFPMLIEGKELSRWFPTKAETDPVVGGHYMFAFESADPSRGTQRTEGAFLEITPYTRVRYSWPTENTEVQIDIVANGDSSEVTLVHTGFAESGNDEKFASTSQGWNFFLANLKSLLEKGVDKRTGKW